MLQVIVILMSFQDCSEFPLFASVDPAVESLSTFAAFTALFDNYKPSPGEVEEQTEEELAEEAKFLDEVAATEVMRTTYQFLVDRGEVIIHGPLGPPHHRYVYPSFLVLYKTFIGNL